MEDKMTSRKRKRLDDPTRNIRPKRDISQMAEYEKWICGNCGKQYKSTSTLTIRKHKKMCKFTGEENVPGAQAHNHETKSHNRAPQETTNQPDPSISMSLQQYAAVLLQQNLSMQLTIQILQQKLSSQEELIGSLRKQVGESTEDPMDWLSI